MTKIATLFTILTLTLHSATFNVATTPELRTALETAATNGEDDTIVLADGTYKTTDDGKGTFIYLSNEANKLTLIGSSSENVILSGDNVEQILNHQSTEDAPMKLEKLSFVDGNNTSGDGGGVSTDYSIDVVDCNFLNNTALLGGGGFDAYFANVNNSLFQNNEAIDNGVNYGGGGFRSFSVTYSTPTIVENSKFINNSSGNPGGGFSCASLYLSSKTIVKNSLFKENKASNGGGFSSSPSSIENSIFESNSAFIGGGFSTSNTTLTNSIFKNNIASYEGSVLSSRHLTASNILVLSDSGSIFLDKGEDNYIYNSIFLTSGTSIKIPSYASDTAVTVKNNYIDESTISTPSFNSNNIFNGVTLGFIDKTNGDYRLTESSDLIDAGTTTIAGLTLPTTDLNGNARVVGDGIDIGPYEFSTTKPTINSFTYSGTAKELNQLSFSVDYTFDGTRTLDNITYDYSNDGSWTADSTHTFDAAGSYVVNVKVTDSEGEFSTTSLTVSVAQITLADKLLTVLTQSDIDSILPMITSDKNTAVSEATATGIATGKNSVLNNLNEYDLTTTTSVDALVSEATAAAKQYVQDNLSEFNLVTLANMEQAIADAETSSLASGKQYVLDNLAEFSLIKEPIKQTIAVTNSWKMVGALSDINDISVFNNSCVDIVWQYKDGIWKAHSTDTTVQQTIANLGYSGLTSIKKSEAFWIHGTGSCEVQTFIDNKPIVSITGAKDLYPINETISLDASSSIDDGSIVKYSWELDGDVVSNNATYIISSLPAGTHTITLEVTDDFGQVSIKTLNINVVDFTDSLPISEYSTGSISSTNVNGNSVVTLDSGSYLSFTIKNDTNRSYAVSKFELIKVYNGIETKVYTQTDLSMLTGQKYVSSDLGHLLDIIVNPISGNLSNGEFIKIALSLNRSDVTNYFVARYTLTDIDTGVEFTNSLMWNGTPD